MSIKKFALPLFVAVLVAFGAQGVASANGPSDPDYGGTVDAQEVRDLVVQASGATDERGMTVRAVAVNRKALKISAAECADPEDWSNYYIGPAIVGSKIKGIAGGTLCSGEKVFTTNPEYLPETYYVWKLMADVYDRTIAQTNEKLHGLYWYGAVGKRIFSNGKKATLAFEQTSRSKRKKEHTLKKIEFLGSKIKVTSFWE